MNDLVLEILRTERQLTIAALTGNAGAGGVFLALAADQVLVRDGVILNPHYRGMGNLYGSEYSTYLLPRRMAAARARTMMESPPAGERAASGRARPGRRVSGADRRPSAPRSPIALRPGRGEGFAHRLAAKNARRAVDEAAKPLAAYRTEELERMKLNFYGFDSSYPSVARQHFVCKVPHWRTPLWLARHRGQARQRA